MEKLNLVLLPGLLNGASLFAPLVDALVARTGITLADLTTADSIGAMATDALAQAPPGRFVLAGMSMGGYVAFEIMRRAPERVRALLLISTSARPDSADGKAARMELIARGEAGFAAVVAQLLARMAHPDHAQTPEVGGMFESMANELGFAVFARQQKAIMGRVDSRPTLARIACPTLILCGRDDQLTPPAVHRELATGIAGARLEIIDDCGHLLPLEQPGRLSKLVGDWLAQLVAGDRP